MKLFPRTAEWSLSTFCHQCKQLPNPALGPLANIGGKSDQLSVFGPPGVFLHGDGLVADVLDLIDTDSLG